jgi:hypothetical protein
MPLWARRSITDRRAPSSDVEESRVLETERVRNGPRDRFPGEDALVAGGLLRVRPSYLASPCRLPNGANGHVHAVARITGRNTRESSTRALP